MNSEITSRIQKSISKQSIISWLASYVAMSICYYTYYTLSIYIIQLATTDSYITDFLFRDYVEMSVLILLSYMFINDW